MYTVEQFMAILSGLPKDAIVKVLTRIYSWDAVAGADIALTTDNPPNVLIVPNDKFEDVPDYHFLPKQSA